MSQAHRLLHVLPRSVPFVDYKAIDWEQVRRTHYWMYQRFRYEYPGPIRDLHQRLMVVPPARHGDQYLCAHKLRVTDSAVSIRQQTDDFGNSVYYLDLPRVDTNVDFEVWSSVERCSDSGRPGDGLPVVPETEAARYLESTHLTALSPNLLAAAQQISRSDDPWQTAENVSNWVWANMFYTAGATTVATTASEALEKAQGLCQDYSHIMIAICRVLGLPARYVSGHLLGEGGSHAWVEVILPAPDRSHLLAVPFDPTNHCRAGLRHITVGVGRDYRDVAPTSGYYTAPYQGQLTSSKRAGLIMVEYHDGELTEIEPPEFGSEDIARRIA